MKGADFIFAYGVIVGAVATLIIGAVVIIVVLRGKAEPDKEIEQTDWTGL